MDQCQNILHNETQRMFARHKMGCVTYQGRQTYMLSAHLTFASKAIYPTRGPSTAGVLPENRNSSQAGVSVLFSPRRGTAHMPGHAPALLALGTKLPWRTLSTVPLGTRRGAQASQPARLHVCLPRSMP